MKSLYSINYPSPIGNIVVFSTSEVLISCHFSHKQVPNDKTKLTTWAYQWLDDYFHKKFNNTPLPPLTPTFKTNFQKKVINYLIETTVGTTLTYGELAMEIDHPLASRAVGTVCSKNPLMLFIPCHRVISSNGIVKYGGGEEIKKFLIMHECID